MLKDETWIEKLIKRWDVNWKTNDNDLPPSWSVNLSWVNELLSSPPPKIPISKIIWKIFFPCKYSLANKCLWPHFWIQTIQKFPVPKLPCWKNLMQGLCAPKRSDISWTQFIYMYRNRCHIANGKWQCLSLENDKSIALPDLEFSIFNFLWHAPLCWSIGSSDV